MIFSPEPQVNAALLRDSTLKIGWCLTDDLKRKSYLHHDIDRGLPYAISIAFPLNDEIIDSIEHKPNLLYQQHYRSINQRLEAEALELARSIQSSGFRALPAPVTVSVDPFHGHLSHRMAAMLSGQGWIGKSALLITPGFGARVRLVTVLTNLPLSPPPQSMVFKCGDCRDCIEACPVNAITEDARNFKRELCYRYLESLINQDVVEEWICGLCVKVCKGENKK